jgi:hypothetical protein
VFVLYSILNWQKLLSEIFQMLKQADGEDCLSCTQCYEWYQCLKLGRTSTEDDPKTELPHTSTDNDHVEKVHVVICENRFLTLHEVSKEVGPSKSVCHPILTEELEMHHAAPKFLLRLLRSEGKVNCVIVSQELFDRSDADENFPRMS